MAPRFLFRLLLVLMGSCHRGGVCELDAAECRQNYAKETHEHVVARPGVAMPLYAPLDGIAGNVALKITL